MLPPRAIGPSEEELASAAALYDAALPPAKRFAFDISALDELGMAVLIESFTGPPIGTNDGFGYGASAAEARVGALGELNETVHLTAALEHDPGERGTLRQMALRHGSSNVIDPRDLCLPAGSPDPEARTLRWLKVRRWPEGEAFVPREFVAISGRNYRSAGDGPPPLITPITNGLGAGSSLAQALSHGLLELFQRDGNCVTFRAMDRGRVVDLKGVTDPGIRTLVEKLRGHGIEPLAKLASTEFGLTNLYVVDGGTAEPPLPLQVTACGEAAHPNAERALRKALLEFIAARCRKALMHGPLPAIEAIAPKGYLATTLSVASPDNEEKRAVDEMVAWLGKRPDELRAMLSGTVLSRREMVPLPALPSAAEAAVAGPADRLADLAARLDEAGLPLLYYDATPSPDGPFVVKAIVPGLECETMSYHRIGARGIGRLLGDPSGLAGVGAPPEGAAAVLLTEAATQKLGGPAWFDRAQADRIVGALYPLYREPSSHTAQLALARQAG